MDLQSFIHLILSMLILPTALSAIGTTLAAVLAQDKWLKEVNAAIAWAVLLIAAGVSAYLAGTIDGDPFHLFASISAFATLLVSGALASLKPYLLWLDLVQQMVFNIAAPFGEKSAARLAPEPPASKSAAQG